MTEEIPHHESRHPELSSQQLALYQALGKKEPALGDMYLGALLVLREVSNPERLAQAAHSLRELMDKIPKYVDVEMKAHRETLGNKVDALDEGWRKLTQNTACHQGGSWGGNVDQPLSRYLQKLEEFFDWHAKHRPRRRVEAARLFRQLDGLQFTLPSFLEHLNVSEWQRLRDYFVSGAHHQRIDDSVFAERLESLESFLIARLHPRAYADLDEIDGIIREVEGNPSPDGIEKAIDAMRRGRAQYEYFFEKIQSPLWIEPLLAIDCFSSPEKPERKGQYIRFPFWPQSRYLSRVASEAPAEVLNVILGIERTENVRVHEDYATAALLMPPNHAARLAPEAKKWIELPYQMSLPEKLGRLVEHLARGNQADAALDLARAILWPLPDPRLSEEEGAVGTLNLPPQPVARFDSWEYEEILGERVPVLIERAKERALSLLSDLLEETIRLSLVDREPEDRDDFSHVWRPAIEEHEQNSDHGPREFLVTAVRDAAEVLIPERGSAILELIESRRFRVFQRIGLYLRRKFPNADADGTARLIAGRDIQEDRALHHESFHLLSEVFGNLPGEVQEAYLNSVDEGPNPEAWLSHRERQTGRRPTEEETEQFVQECRYWSLWPIQEFLNQQWRARFESLKESFGELDHPDLLVYSRSWSGPTSPKTSADLESVSVEDIVTYLRNWEPSDASMAPSPEGLGRALTQCVAADPRRFAEAAMRFERCDATYVRALLMGFNEACRQQLTFPWNSVLQLCQWVVDQPRVDLELDPQYGIRDPGWSWTRRAIAGLLRTALSQTAEEPDYGLRRTIWDIIRPLTDDPDPTPEDEDRFGGSNMSPVDLSLNTVRGEAMLTAIHYGLWIRRCMAKSRGIEDLRAAGFDEMPELREVLDQHLDLLRDPSSAIRSVYGRLYPQLFLIDPNWASENIPKIFPEEDHLQTLRYVAWEAYLVWNRIYDEVFDVLRGEYDRAVDQIDPNTPPETKQADLDLRLTEHVLIMFIRGKLKYGVPNDLLRRFYSNAREDMRSHVIRFIGRDLRKLDTSPGDNILRRLRSLWTERLAEARAATPKDSYISEIASFGWWFVCGKFEENWALEELRNAINFSGSVDPRWLVVERLADMSTTRPSDAVDCLRLMVEPGGEGIGFHQWEGHATNLLSNVLSSRDDNARRIAVDVINRLIQHGHRSFRDLLGGKSNT
jgi:hypothetical protein